MRQDDRNDTTDNQRQTYYHRFWFFPFRLVFFFVIIFVFLAIVSGIAGYYNVSVALFVGISWIFWVFVLLFVLFLVLRVFFGGFWYGGYSEIAHVNDHGNAFHHPDWERMALNRAKMRLAAGEISEKEYKNIVKLIKSK